MPPVRPGDPGAAFQVGYGGRLAHVPGKRGQVDQVPGQTAFEALEALVKDAEVRRLSPVRLAGWTEKPLPALAESERGRDVRPPDGGLQLVQMIPEALVIHASDQP
jgi:hypothetical protein